MNNSKLDTIFDYICHAFMVDKKVLFSKNKTKRVSWARHASYQLLCDLYGMTDGETSLFMGRCRCSGVLSRATARNLLETNKHFSEAYEHAYSLIKNDQNLRAQ